MAMDGDDILRAVTALLPEVERCRDETADLRQLPGPLVASLRQAGAFRLPMPASWGGPEMTPRAQTELVEILATADPSVSWCVMIGSDAGFYSSFLDDGVGRKLFADMDTVVAGWLMPAGRAVQAEGGYLVSGRWSFGSCCRHADLLVGGCFVYDGDDMVMRDDGMPEIRNVISAASDFEILDTWHTLGLAGSGSNDYTAEDLFVPAEHTFSLADGSKRRRPLYVFPGMFLANMHGVGLGLARRAIDEVRQIAEHKMMMPEMQLMRDVGRVRSAVARAEMQLGAARAYTYSTLDATWEHLQHHDELTVGLRRDLALSRVLAFRTARDVAQSMVDTAGAQAIYRTSVLQRLLADAITVNEHIVAQERMLEMVGGLVLGVESPLPFV